MWIVFALLSALFAATTAVFSKIGVENVNSTLAVAIRTIVVLLMSWVMVFVTNSGMNPSEISKKSWIFLALSGIATGASWLCYYRALQLGKTTEVAALDKLSVVFTLVFAALILNEQITIKSALGVIFITVGAILMAI